MKSQYIYGIHPVLNALLHKPDEVLEIILLTSRRDQRIDEILALAEQHRISKRFLSCEQLNRLANTEHHQGVVALMKAAPIQGETQLKELLQSLQEPAFLLILDEVQDPHNLGACLRTADAAGVHAVIAPKDKAASITPLVRKVASGAAETVPFFQITNLARTLRFLKELNIWIYGLADDAENNFYETNFTDNIALVLGAEGTGLRRLTKELCDQLLYLPMAGSVSSLNVSVAAGVCLYEVVRQRTKPL